MEHISLKQVYFGGVTMQVPEIWEVETEEFEEFEGQGSYGIDINATGADVRSVNISYSAMPEGADAFAEACGTYEEIMEEEDLDANDEPIITFKFKGHDAYGFTLTTDDGLPCFFFCADVKVGGKYKLLTVLSCAANDEELESLVQFVQEYITLE